MSVRLSFICYDLLIVSIESAYELARSVESDYEGTLQRTTSFIYEQGAEAGIYITWADSEIQAKELMRQAQELLIDMAWSRPVQGAMPLVETIGLFIVPFCIVTLITKQLRDARQDDNLR